MSRQIIYVSGQISQGDPGPPGPQGPPGSPGHLVTVEQCLSYFNSLFQNSL